MVALTPHNDCLAVEQIHNYQGCECYDDDCVNSVHDSLCCCVYCTRYVVVCQTQIVSPANVLAPSKIDCDHL